VFVAPEKEFSRYERTFGDMTNSIRFTQPLSFGDRLLNLETQSEV